MPATGKPRVVILGSGPNRIGQGIEFDYCCVHAAQSFRALGYEAIMVNCNPETVSTDYDTSDRLYFEPLDVEHVLAVCERERPEGVVIQFGGQTPLKLARAIEAAGFKVLGTPYEAVDLAEDRSASGSSSRSSASAARSGGSRHAAGGGRDRRTGRLSGARAALLRPRRPRDAGLLRRGAGARCDGRRVGSVLVDRFLEGALEIDVDALRRRLGARRRRDGARRGSGDPPVTRPASSRRPRWTTTRMPRSAASSAGSGRRSASSAC